MVDRVGRSDPSLWVILTQHGQQTVAPVGSSPTGSVNVSDNQAAVTGNGIGPAATDFTTRFNTPGAIDHFWQHPIRCVEVSKTTILGPQTTIELVASFRVP